MTDAPSAPFITDRFDDALAYASRLHRSQARKGNGVPYVSHLLAVAAIALENGADEDQAIAALLHDAVEDQGGLAQLEVIRGRFGEDVAAMVADCTDAHEEPKPAWRPRKEAYIASLAYKPARSLAVSLADKTHNAAAINADLRAVGEGVWSRFGALCVFAWLLTQIETEHAGRAYAAYGGIYILSAMAWTGLVEGVRPDRWDICGVALCVAGGAIILWGPRPV